MKEYHGARIAGREELDGVDFPSEVQLAIDDLAGSMREGLLALSVGVGLKVMNELIEEELTQLVGPKGKNDRARGAKRHGSRRVQVVLGGRKVPARRPRPRTAKRQGGVEVAHLLALRLRGPAPGADRRARAGGALDPPLPRCLEPTATADRSVSRSAVSRRFVKRTGPALYSYAGDWAENVGAIDATFLGWAVGGTNG